ncbi:MAG TPA: proprotein convertase P-domain-containing protein [Phycisphaerae bacterium]|nr:proprotein convertase P-domain-containing protein [Phycisphaerae bacterium]
MGIGTSRIGWGFAACLCCLTAAALTLSSVANATPPVGKTVQINVVGADTGTSRTQIAYSTNLQPITKLTLQDGATAVSATGSKLVLYVDNGAAGSAVLHVEMPDSPQVNVTVHVDGKIRADVAPINSSKPSELGSPILGTATTPQPAVVKHAPQAPPSIAAVDPSSVTDGGRGGLSTSLAESAGFMVDRPYRTAKLRNPAAPRGCPVVCPPGATAENEPDCGLPTDTVNGGCNSTPNVFSAISCGETVCGTGAFDGSFRDTDWYKLVLTEDTTVTFTGEADFDLLIGIVDNFGIDSCAGVTSFLSFGLGGACTPASASACLSAGTWYLFVAPDFTVPVACGAGYTATVTCKAGECGGGGGVCGPPNPNDCNAANSTPGCSDQACCEAVCAIDPFCCDVAWDSICASEAADLCGGGGGVCGPDNPNDCSVPNSTPGCNDQACCEAVCAIDPFCCDVAWDSICADEAASICNQPPCDVICDPGKTPENEPDCGIPTDTVNGGCNSTPNVFSPIVCGQSYCGTGAFDGSLRDTDWYEVVLTQATQVTWTAEAEFDVVVGIVENGGGTLDCSQVTAFRVFAVGGPCQPTSVSSCLPAGTWWLFVAPDFTAIEACGAEYNATLTCADCPPAPDNDLCEDAEAILCNSSTNLDNTLATTDPTDPLYSCAFFGPQQGFGTLWYTFVATDTSAYVQTCNSGSTDTLLAVYSGTCGSLVEIACNDDGPCGGTGLLSKLCAQGLTVGDTYYIQVSSFSAADQGQITLELTCPCPPGPPGDNCQDAVPLAIPADVSGSTTSSNPDVPPAFTCGGFSVSAPGNWYTVVGNGNELTASLCNPGTNYDTKLHVYCGTCTQLFCVAGDDDFCGFPPGYSQASWCSAPGTTYYILVSGFGSATGDYQLTVTSGAACSDPPLCEPCAVSCDPGKTDENEPDCGLPTDTVNGGCNSVPPVFSPITCGEAYCGTGAFDGSTRDTDWYQVVLTQNTQVTWSVEAEFDVLVGIVDNQGGALDCSQVSAFLVFAVGTPCQTTSVSTCLSAGTWWLFVAPDFLAPVPCGAEYNAVLTCADCPPGPDNDLCVDAEAILCNSTTNMDNTLATTDATDPLYSCAFFGPQQGFGTLWYTFVATNSSAKLSTCGSASTDTLLAVYSGTCPSLVEIACNDDLPCGPTTFLSELCVTNLTVGDTYYIQVSSFSNADRGPIELVLECPCPGFEPTGACCVDDVCSITTQSQCAGEYLGDGTTCDSPGGTPTVYLSNPNAAIPDNNPAGISNTINVPDSMTIADLNVDLVIPHTWVGDLCVTLTHGATTVDLIQRPGSAAPAGCYSGSPFGCDQDNYNIILDDQGSGGPIESLCSPSMVSPPNYVPNNPLAAFNGADAAGPWIITVVDNAGGDLGTLVQWSLHFSEPGPSPCNIEPCDECPAGTIPIVDENGDNSGWCVSASDPANVSIVVEDVDRTAGTATLHINKNFANPPGFGGLIPCILLDFVQVCPDVRTVDTFLINGETITNNTGVEWLDFHWILFDGPEAWFDVAASDDFDVSPFLSKLFSRFIDSPANNQAKKLDAYNGSVPAGGTFSPSGGTVGGGSPIDVVSNPNAAIPDNNPAGVSDVINVGDSVTMADVNVDLVVNHTWVGDLVVTLTHGADSVVLVDRPGVPASTFGCDQNNYNIILDDQGAGGAIETLCAVSMVSPPNYVPNNPLAAFNGDDSAGAWTITVSDNAGQDTGTLVQWSLHITPQSTSSGEPLTIGVDLSGPQVSFTLKECPTTTGEVEAGACCIGLDCSILTPADCAASLGLYKGDGSACTPGICLPANDECGNCISVATGTTYNGTTLGATGTDVSSCAFNDTIDVWHCWTATCTGQATFSLCGSGFDTTLAVYGACGGAELGCNDDAAACSPGSQLSLAVTTGQVYFIRVSGFNGDAGNYSLNVTCSPAGPNRRPKLGSVTDSATGLTGQGN